MDRRIRSKNKPIHPLNLNVIKKGYRDRIRGQEKNTDIVVLNAYLNFDK